MQMTFQEAVRVLREAGTRCDSTGLYNLGHYTAWTVPGSSGWVASPPGIGEIALDDHFDLEELRAIVVFVETMKANPKAMDELMEDEKS